MIFALAIYLYSCLEAHTACDLGWWARVRHAFWTGV